MHPAVRVHATPLPEEEARQCAHNVETPRKLLARLLGETVDKLKMIAHHHWGARDASTPLKNLKAAPTAIITPWLR